jgi:Na+-translocating ferredoxin:NAD+ oxidoreductase RnfD subunit
MLSFDLVCACIFVAGAKLIWLEFGRKLRWKSSLLFLLSYAGVAIVDECLSRSYGYAFDTISIALQGGLILAGFIFMLRPVWGLIRKEFGL